MNTILLFLLITTGGDPVHAMPRFGVVTWQSDGSACATFAEEVAEGRSLEIAVFDPQGTIEGTVVRRTEKPCHESAQITGTSYVIASGEKKSNRDIGIAIVGPASHVTARMCASNEGLHLTAWADDRRLWHEYFYLGYDLDPDCTEEEWTE